MVRLTEEETLSLLWLDFLVVCCLGVVNVPVCNLYPSKLTGSLNWTSVEMHFGLVSVPCSRRRGKILVFISLGKEFPQQAVGMFSS